MKKNLKKVGKTEAAKEEMKTVIEFDKKQYDALVRAVAVAGSIYGLMTDFVDKNYEKESDALEHLESWILAFAGRFGMADMVEIFEGDNVLKDDVVDRYTDDLVQYEEWAFWDVLAHKLTDRELARRYKAGELKNMTEDQILDLHFELEEKYEKELDKNGIEHFELKEK